MVCVIRDGNLEHMIRDKISNRTDHMIKDGNPDHMIRDGNPEHMIRDKISNRTDHMIKDGNPEHVKIVLHNHKLFHINRN